MRFGAIRSPGIPLSWWRRSRCLAGLTFAVKDLLDVAGAPTGGGNPDWLREQLPAKNHAWAVARLLDAGATLAGKIITDELAFSLTGCNVHYGTPLNPAAIDRILGGSSSGSVSAVAGGVVDFALGTDTGGSVRVPASYCGVYGIRPTHDRIPLGGVVKFAPSFDTVGWFAREAQLLEQVGNTLLGNKNPDPNEVSILRADDAFALADPETAAVCDRFLKRAAILVNVTSSVRVCPGSLNEWTQVFRTLRSIEVWRNKGPWIQRAKPRFGPDIARNFAAAARTTEAEAALMRPLSSGHFDTALGTAAWRYYARDSDNPRTGTAARYIRFRTRKSSRPNTGFDLYCRIRRSTANQYSRRFCRRRAGWLVISRCAGK
jgi:amidase